MPDNSCRTKFISMKIVNGTINGSNSHLECPDVKSGRIERRITRKIYVSLISIFNSFAYSYSRYKHRHTTHPKLMLTIWSALSSSRLNLYEWKSQPPRVIAQRTEHGGNIIER